MKVKITEGGGYQGTVLDLDALPRQGETVRIGDWEAEVIKVTHLPSANASGKRYRADDEPGALLVLGGSHQVR
jgi:hypothetical protein